ncbi:N-acetylmuramoyl-L-alanine amidase [Maritimibacter sp. UBA3975]|uniref:N-acetylmuramoyl-L-alanine amidase n=1 Tax=Maritimibacter sp. UBA3975 TaxID=1946833 RepID=UPI000C0BAE0A|nr:N-acetylmuramoyl-L-alanine amidase [Maritimibacter sp. UBA3975]MAM60129.1 N-acetylmuramoyl-L-alanine amidase [Maritimibacter sp.]|tara:strand:+ start:3665 stop:4861 length:1197 start_codon:yes stop_codon:yes gene_type:complete
MIRAVLLFLMVAWAGVAQAQLSALARLDGDGLVIARGDEGLMLDLEMTRAVPWRVFSLADPARLVVDFSELDWTGVDEAALASVEGVTAVRTGLFRPGWSRLVVTLDDPFLVEQAGMRRVGQDGARVGLTLVPTDAETFAAEVGAPESAVFDMADPLPPVSRGEGPLVVVLDPGHGGIDPGAEREGIREADLMLTFARELKEVLLRQDGIDVVLTRDEDVFVPLEERVSFARAAGADIFLSLHADALAEGRANGATVYTLAEEATDIASQKLAERHDRADLLAGVDLNQTGDEVALVLMDMARTETQPRSDALADAIVDGIRTATQSTYKTPRLEAGFSVLKAPDIPSVLIELGFLSSKRDREKMVDSEWRRRAAEGIRDAVLEWALEDQAAKERLRQ